MCCSFSSPPSSFLPPMANLNIIADTFRPCNFIDRVEWNLNLHHRVYIISFLYGWEKEITILRRIYISPIRTFRIFSPTLIYSIMARYFCIWHELKFSIRLCNIVILKAILIEFNYLLFAKILLKSFLNSSLFAFAVKKNQTSFNYCHYYFCCDIKYFNKFVYLNNPIILDYTQLKKKESAF